MLDADSGPLVAGIAVGGIVLGLGLLIRGFGSYRTAIRIGDTATSRIGSLAVGEVRVSGTVETAELSLVSPLQSARCVYYRSRVEDRGDTGGTALDEERAVGFRVRDETGNVRVFPRGATFDVPVVFVEETGALESTPPGLHLRAGRGMGPGEPTREQQIADLLAVPAPSETASWQAGRIGGGSRHYVEARIQPGDTVTVVGRAMPFDQLPDPTYLDAFDAHSGARSPADPIVAADLAEARAAGILAVSPEEAWGNAAIPGFGIGRPVSPPELHPDARVLPLAGAPDAARADRLFAIAPSTLVLAAAADSPLVIAAGTPGHATERHADRFLLGLLGAVLAIGAAILLAAVIAGAT